MDGVSWPNGARNFSDSTTSAPSVCVFENQAYLFWKGADSSNRLYYSVSSDGWTWPYGRPINGSDASPEAPAACVLNGNNFVLFWKANDPSNTVYWSALGGALS